jgi:hypothetical protein
MSSDSAVVGPGWSAGILLAAKTQFQASGGSVWIATGATAPAKLIAGNAVPSGKAIEIEAGFTVYWRTDEAVETVITWLETGA